MMRILVVGDPLLPASAFREAFRPLAGEHDVTFVDVVDEPDWRPASPSELRLKEYMGSPDQVIAALDGHDVLVVQGAPVTDAVLDAAPPAARLLRPRRPGQRRPCALRPRAASRS